MAKYRVLDFLKDHNIHYRTDGPNCSKGNVVIQCPWCGDADHSEHMGILLTGERYGCWRDDSHRGGALEWLVAEVLSISPTEALRVLSSYGEGPVLPGSPDQGFRDIIRSKLGKLEEIPIANIDIPPPSLKMPSDWMRIQKDSPFTRFAYNYMISRGFTAETLERYPLFATQTGKYAYRVIFPVSEDGKLVSWTGRATSGSMGLRYLSLEALPEAQGGWQIKHFIWGYDYAMRGSTGPVLVHEGPMDGLKSCQWLHGRGDAVALFNSSMDPRQMKLLMNLMNKGRKLIFCMDPDALSHTFKMWQSMRVFGDAEGVYLTGGTDAGAMDEAGFEQAFSKFLS